MGLVDMNLKALNRKDPPARNKYIRTRTSGEISEGGNVMKYNTESVIDYLSNVTDYVFEKLSRCFNFVDYDLWKSIFDCMAHWTWGRKYNFLHNMKDKAVPAALLKSEMRDYIDAGLLLNSPYFSVLREERDIDLIISLDFSDGDPFTTVREAAETCKKLKIPFPEVNIPSGDVKKPKDFYVFKGQNTPTVIHIPLFNVVNCGGDIEKWRKKYHTFQGSYSAEMITDLMEVAGKNITNNRDNLLEQICLAIKMHK
ncbi:hypothetical protein R3I93_002557 [Phoxinus phoxinus]|uniref:PLA2c domain-containing protein n=1 Tax=Phoxinus phoxinus TaxID=58324 RepID=A0AAN9DI39_9TELE